MKAVLKKARVPIIVTLLALLAISYYIYLNNRDTSTKSKATTAKETPITRDMSEDYPEGYCDVVDYFVQLQKVIYKDDLSDDELAGYAQHMRALFDDELLSQNGNDYETYLMNLKLEIVSYKADDKSIKNYEVQSKNTVATYKIDSENYAEVSVKYYFQVDDDVVAFYEKYTLRQDDAGQWKILYWEMSDGSDMN